MTEVYKVKVGGLIGGDGGVNVLGAELPVIRDKLIQSINKISLMVDVGCFHCLVVTGGGNHPDLEITPVVGATRSRIGVTCRDAVIYVKKSQAALLGCHTPQTVEVKVES